MPRLVLLLVVAAIAAASTSACGASPSATRIPLTPLPGARVGPVEGTRAFVALSLEGRTLRVYVCDGTLKRDPTIATWFEHRWDGRNPLTMRRDEHTLEIDAVGKDGRTTGAPRRHARLQRESHADAGGALHGSPRGHPDDVDHPARRPQARNVHPHAPAEVPFRPRDELERHAAVGQRLQLALRSFALVP